MRYWWETPLINVCFNARSRSDALESGCRWFPHNKGGSFRKWYGNSEYVVDWLADGAAIKAYENEQGQLAAYPRNQDCYFKECISWSKISSGKLAFRWKEYGDIFNEVAPAIFGNAALLRRLEAFLNSSVCMAVAELISPTLDFQVGQVADYPVADAVVNSELVDSLVATSIDRSKVDWDSFETSWDFKRHPLV